MSSNRRSALAHAIVSKLPQRAATSILGAASRVRIPRTLRAPLWSAYSRLVGADLDEVGQELHAYPRFEDFFTRTLRPGTRVFEGEHGDWSSPCDGKIAAGGEITNGKMIQAKGIDYSVEELVGDDVELSPTRYLTIYLSPADYHRVHFPVDGRLVKAFHHGGELWPVAAFVVEREQGVFVRNERVAVHFKDEAGRPCAMVLVAAFGVANIKMTEPPIDTGIGRTQGVRRFDECAGRAVARGAECGMFALGSTVILLIDDSEHPLDSFPPMGHAVRTGELIARSLA